MSRSIREAYGEAKKPAFILPSHLTLGPAGVINKRSKRAIPDQEIVMLEPHSVLGADGYPVHAPHYVHACPIPLGYFEHMIELQVLQQRSMTSNAVPVAERRMADEGYATKDEFARAMMVEHLASTSYVVEVAYDDDGQPMRPGEHRVVEGVVLPSFVRQEPKPRTSRVFHVSQAEQTPDELIHEREFDRDIAHALKALVSLGDWDPALAYATLKEWDALVSCYERLKYNTVEYGNKKKQELAALYRNADATGDEIPRRQVEQLNEQLKGLRLQSYYYSRKHKTALVERDRAVDQSGIKFGPHLSLAEKAKRSAQLYRQKDRQRATELDRLFGMSPEGIKHLYESGILRQEYKPRLDGVNADDGKHNRVTLGDTDLD